MSSKRPYCHIELLKGKTSLKVELGNLNTKDGAPKAKKSLMLQFSQSHEPVVLYHGESYCKCQTICKHNSVSIANSAN